MIRKMNLCTSLMIRLSCVGTTPKKTEAKMNFITNKCHLMIQFIPRKERTQNSFRFQWILWIDKHISVIIFITPFNLRSITKINNFCYVFLC